MVVLGMPVEKYLAAEVQSTRALTAYCAAYCKSVAPAQAVVHQEMRPMLKLPPPLSVLPYQSDPGDTYLHQRP
jgi:hypothetical protein